MYAIVITGGKQYKVEENQTIKVEKIEAEIGSKIKLDVLMLVDGDKVVNGNPVLENAEVMAEVLNHDKQKKLVVFKYKPKKHKRVKQGHRQPFTTLKIVSVK